MTLKNSFSKTPKKLLHSIVQPAEKLRTASAKLAIDSAKLVSSLSYSHFELLVEIEDPLKRAFYEVEGIRANWSVRELKRQIATLYYERTGLSKNSGIGFKPILKRNGLFAFSLTIEDYRRRKK